MNVIKKATHSLFAVAALTAVSCDPPPDADSAADIGVDSESEGFESETGPAAVSGEVFDDFARPDSEALGRTPVGGWLWVPAEEPAVLQGETLHGGSPDGTRGGQAGGGAKLQGFLLRDGRLTADVVLPEGGMIRARLGDLALELELGRLSAQGASGPRVEVEVSESSAGSLEVALEGGLVSVWLGEALVLGPFEAAYAGGEVELWVQAEASIDTFAFVPSGDEERGSREGGAGSAVRADGPKSISASRGDSEPAEPGGAPNFSAPGDGGDGDGGTEETGNDVVQVSADAPRVTPGTPEDQDLTVPTTLYKMVRFLYDPSAPGGTPTQLEADIASLPPSAISLVYGQLLDAWGAPVVGAEVFALDKPEYGHTYSRADGTYDLVIAGGRATDIVIVRDGLLSAQRSTEVEVGDSVRLDDVIMLEVDVEATVIDFSDPIQVHHAFTPNDGWPDRMTTLMFRGGTQATMRFADGTTQALPSMTVHTTEYTVGDEGELRMPAKLPPGTAYNYALEISADEAEALGAVSVELDTPAALYVDNFRNFPVGSLMPNGSFDREDGRWHPESTGLVLEVLGVDSEGLAILDFNGDGSPTADPIVESYGITDPELAELASIYAAGAQLWRVEIPHFTPYDINPNLRASGSPAPGGQRPDEQGLANSCEVPGSVISMESRVLGESLPVHGTPFSLHYSSNRVPGGPNRTMGLTVDDPNPPEGLERVSLVVDVAGRRLMDVADPEPGRRLEVQWDGLDGFGQPTQGAQPVTMCIAYGFPSSSVVMDGAEDGGVSANDVRFGQWPAGAYTTHLSDSSLVNYVKCYGNEKSVAAAAAGSITKADRFRLGGLDASLLSDRMGGWTLNVHHTLSRATATLHRGDGRERDLAREAVLTASRFLGVQQLGGTQAGAGPLVSHDRAEVLAPSPSALAAGPDGSIYVGSRGLVRRVATDGAVSVVAGTVNPSGGAVSPAVIGTSGDGGPATAAQLSSAVDAIALDSDGGLYVADSARLRYVDSDGMIDTVWTSASGPIQDLAIVPGGVLVANGIGNDRQVWLFIADHDGGFPALEFLAGQPSPIDGEQIIENRLSLCTPQLCDGVSIGTELRRWGPGPPYDAGPDVGGSGQSIYALLADEITSVAANRGRVYVSQRGGSPVDRRVRVIKGYRGGPISTFRRRLVANPEVELPWNVTSQGIPVGDMLNPLESQLPLLEDRDENPPSVVDMVATNNGLYYTTAPLGGAPGGLQRAVNSLEYAPELLMGAEGATAFVGGDDIRLARTVALGGTTDVVRGRDGALYVADLQRNVVLKVARAVPPMYLPSWVTSEDGSEVYSFDDEGRHLETRDARTHALIYAFEYDSGGLLESVDDAFGRTTLFHRDGNGNLTGIEGPYEHLTDVSVDANGFLDTVTDPSNAVTDIQHSANGLLTRIDEPGSEGATEFYYDDRGALIEDRKRIAYTDPDGMSESVDVSQDVVLDATPDPENEAVRHVSAELRETTYWFERQGSEVARRVTFPDQTRNESNHSPEVDEVTFADGTVVTTHWGADARLGPSTRAPDSIHVASPAGVERTTTFEREFEPRCTIYLEDTECTELFVLNRNLRADRVVETVHSGDDEWTSTYDRAHIDAGALVPAQVVAVGPSGRTTTTTLDAYGRVSSLQVGALAPVQYGYDTQGRVSSISQADGVQTRSVGFGYHPTQGWLETITDAAGHTTTFQRDAVGRILRQTDAEVLDFTYDAAGNVTSVTPPSRPAHDFHYDSADRLREYEPPTLAGVTDPATRYTYTPDHQPADTTLPHGSLVDYTFDTITGKLGAVDTPEAEYAFAYHDGIDQTGRLESVAVHHDDVTLGSISLAYSFDGDLLTEETLDGPVAGVAGTVTWGYDDRMRLDEETVEGQTVAYGYTGELLTTMGAMTAAYVPGTGQLDTTTLGNVETSYTYDGFGDLAGILYEASNSPVYEVTYTRDTAGRVQTKTETRGATSTLRCYEYDASDRLAGVFDAADSGGCTGTQLEAYGYDANGNRQSVTNSAGFVPAVQIVTDAQDRLLQHGVFTYEYNDDGQMTSREDTSSGDVWLYTYDAVGNLREVDPPGIGGTISYVIDPRNRRVGRRVDGTLVQGFLYGDQLNPIAELDGSGAVVSRFVYGTSDHVPDYMVRGGTTYRFETDHLGSVVGVIDLSTGSEVQRREYDAYGRVLLATSWTAAGFSQPFGFAGGLYDEDTGLVRFGARDYRPEVGSWAAKDPLRFEAGDASLYSYCFGDAVGWVDLTGLDPKPAYGSADEAAYAWAKRYYKLKFAKEICAPIRFFDIDMGRGKEVRYYYYDDPIPGIGEDACDPWRKSPGGRPPADAVGDCHTHGDANEDYENEKMSRADIETCRRDTGKCWLFTPAGACFFYHVGRGIVPCPGWAG